MLSCCTSSVIQIVTYVTWAGKNPPGVCKQQVINKNVILQCFRSLFGNLFTFFKFEGKSQIDRETRHQVIYVLGGVAAASVFAFLMLRDSKSNKNRKEGNEERGPLVELKKTWSIFLTKEMLILNLTFCFTGKHNRTKGQKQHFCMFHIQGQESRCLLPAQVTVKANKFARIKKPLLRQMMNSISHQHIVFQQAVSSLFSCCFENKTNKPFKLKQGP